MDTHTHTCDTHTRNSIMPQRQQKPTSRNFSLYFENFHNFLFPDGKSIYALHKNQQQKMQSREGGEGMGWEKLSRESSSKISAHNPLTPPAPKNYLRDAKCVQGRSRRGATHKRRFSYNFPWLMLLSHLHNEFICLIKSTREHEYIYTLACVCVCV